jgi:hypothetical protein
MSLAAMLSQTATVKHYTYTEDGRGNQVRNVATSTDYPCRLEQTDSQEINTGQQTKISNWRIYLPPDASLDSEDQVVVAEKTYEVLGPPDILHTPRGPHHQAARLRYVE